MGAACCAGGVDPASPHFSLTDDVVLQTGVKVRVTPDNKQTISLFANESLGPLKSPECEIAALVSKQYKVPQSS